MVERDGGCCTRCPMTQVEHRAIYGRGLHVHRLDPGSVYTLNGCVTLCKPCHTEAHGGTRPCPPAKPLPIKPRTKAMPFRLGPDVLTMLDAIAADRAARTKLDTTRTDAVKAVIREEHARLVRRTKAS